MPPRLPGAKAAATHEPLTFKIPQSPDVLIVDDAPGTQKLFADAVGEAFEDASVHCEETLEEAQRQMVRLRRPDLAVINLGLSGYKGTEAFVAFRRKFVRIAVVISCEQNDFPSMIGSLKAGAAGCIPANFDAPAIVAALRLVQRGCSFVPPQLIPCLHIGAAAEVLAGSASTLTERKRELLRLVLKGHNNAAIAKELEITAGTVKQHLNAIFRTIGVSSRVELFALAVRGGIRKDRSPITEVV